MKKHFHMNEPKIVCISCYKTVLQLPRNIKNGESFPEKFPDREILLHKQEAVSFPDKFTDKETLSHDEDTKIYQEKFADEEKLDKCRKKVVKTKLFLKKKR